MGVISVEEHEPEFFFELAHWAKENRVLRPWERSLVFNIGRYVSKGWKLSTKQEQHAQERKKYGRK